MSDVKEMEAYCLEPAHYRRLWLDEAHALGQVAETLADALGWQPTAQELLPDGLELARAAAERIAELELQLTELDRGYVSERRALHRIEFALN